jgi:hypothetical protein
MRYTEQGYLVIDNNLAERALRQVVASTCSSAPCIRSAAEASSDISKKKTQGFALRRGII